MVVPDGSNEEIKVAARQLKEETGARTSQNNPEDSSNIFDDVDEGDFCLDDDSSGDGEDCEAREKAPSPWTV
jgi:hypothetical protein